MGWCFTFSEIFACEIDFPYSGTTWCCNKGTVIFADKAFDYVIEVAQTAMTIIILVTSRYNCALGSVELQLTVRRNMSCYRHGHHDFLRRQNWSKEHKAFE